MIDTAEITWVTNDDVVEMYRDMIDETNPTVMINGLEYDPSRVLERVSPMTFDIGLDEYVDSLADDGIRVRD